MHSYYLLFYFVLSVLVLPAYVEIVVFQCGVLRPMYKGTFLRVSMGVVDLCMNRFVFNVV